MSDFFDAQWRVFCVRWPWDDGQEEAMRFYRERLRVRAALYSPKALGIVMERFCARQDFGRRPSVDELGQAMRDLEPGRYEPPKPVSDEQRARAKAALADYLARQRWAEKS